MVQGVGYRPFVHRLALELGIDGTVLNDGAGVLIEAHADEHVLGEFARRLRDDAPPLASVRAVSIVDRRPASAPPAERGFRIIESIAVGGSDVRGEASVTALPPDVAVCADCLREMRDPHDRRHNYPFVTCTQCGPRFTITRRMPYDRPNTTMTAFALCADCQREYDDPADRRHHAQPLACPVCGPHLLLTDAAGAVLATRDGALRAAQELLAAGAIVAAKALGGYHLMCDATNPTTVAELRRRKRRGDKPLAVLVAGIDDAVSAGVALSAAELDVLASPQRPIVLVRVGATSTDTNSHPASREWMQLCAPGAADIGVMLPCTPVQHLLFDDPATPRLLVCTSGNVADEPIAIDDSEARDRLAAIADAFLANDRPIHTACDDSVVRVHAGRVSFVRRARGYVPLPVALPAGGPPVLAMGGDLKGALCLAGGDLAFMSQHLGDHGQLATYEAARRAAHDLCELVGVLPQVVAVDAHPGYLSARLGRELAAAWGLPVHEVHHHHAHAMSIAAEHGVGDERGVGDELLVFAFDGTGYGPDGTIWGGEVLAATAGGFRRVAHLRPVALPGGDAAIEHPARSALAHLRAAGIEWHDSLAPVAATAATDREALWAMLEQGRNTVATSSVGRLFDAVAALCGVRQQVDYEAQAAIELEAIADLAPDGAYAFALPSADGSIDASPVIAAVVADLAAGTPPSAISTRFHRALVSCVSHVASWYIHDTDAETRARGGGRAGRGGGAAGADVGERGVAVGLSGGVFQNLLLADLCTQALTREGFTVLQHRQVPTNDGGLALGQAVIARAAASRQRAGGN